MTYVVELKDKLLKNDHERRRLLQLEEDNEDRNRNYYYFISLRFHLFSKM
jgi:hypothetical protein